VIGQDAERQHPLGPVDEGEPLLGLQRQGFQAGIPEGILRGARRPAVAVGHQPLAGDAERDVRQLGEVPAGPHRPSAGDRGMDGQVQQVRQAHDHVGADARVPCRQSPGPQQDHSPDHLDGKKVAGPRGVTADDVPLEVL
jgi:hypothetical protein